MRQKTVLAQVHLGRNTLVFGIMKIALLVSILNMKRVRPAEDPSMKGCLTRLVLILIKLAFDLVH